MHDKIKDMDIADMLMMALVKRNFLVKKIIMTNASNGKNGIRYPSKIT
jgi:hypothetical protein